MRRDLEIILSKALTLPPCELPKLLGELAEISATLTARLMAPVIEREDKLLTVGDAAKRMKLSTNYLYRHARRYPFTRREGRKLLFSSNGLDSYLKKAR